MTGQYIISTNINIIITLELLVYYNMLSINIGDVVHRDNQDINDIHCSICNRIYS